MVKILLPKLAWLARFCAWSFAVGTLLGVGWMFFGSVRRADRHPTVMTNGIADARGLTYAGRPGPILALVEFVLVAGALWASTSRCLTCRAIGHLLLILWTGLWAANAFYVFADGTFNLIYILPFLFVCTCVRASLDLRKRSTFAAAEKPV